MKQFILILTILFTLSANAQKFDLVEINAKWNQKNHVTFTEVDGVPVKKAFLEANMTTFCCNLCNWKNRANMYIMPYSFLFGTYPIITNKS